MQSRFLALGILAVFAVGNAFAGVPLVINAAESHIEFSVKATMGSFVGQLKDYDATVVVDPATRAVETAVVSFRFTDLRTGDEKRDGHMNEWEQIETYPIVRFVLTSLVPDGTGGGQATGQLTLHGQTRELAFPVSVLTENRTYVIDGEASLDTQDFGLPIIRKFLALKVNPIVTVQFHLQGALPFAEQP